MTSAAETILKYIYDRFVSASINIERNSVVPEKVTEEGLVILRDGDPGEPERLLGGFEASYYTHAIPIELFVQNGNANTRDQRYDTLLTAVKNVLYADKTFGGLIYGFETSKPEAETLPVENGPPIKAGNLIITLEYETNNPLD